MGYVSSFVHRVYQSAGITETAAGKSIRVQLGDIPQKIEGKVVHLAGLLFRGTFQFDAVAVNMPAACPSYLFDTALRNVRLESEGHAFLDNVDGFDIKLDHQIRTGNDGTPLSYSDIADSDATDGTRNIEFVYRLDNPNGVGPARMDGVIPIPLLDHKSSSNNVLSFQIAQNLDGFAGVTLDGFTALEVYAYCVCLDAPRFPAPHRLRYVQSVERSIPVNIVGAAEYIVANTRDDGSAFTPTPSNYDGIHLTVGDSLLWAARSSTEVGYQAQIQRGPYPADEFLTGSGAEWLPIFVQPPGAMRTKMLRGRVLVQIDTRSNYSDTRLLYRETGVHNKQQQARWANRLGIKSEPRRQLANIAPGKGGGAAAILDMKVTSPELAMQYPSVRQKVARS